MAYEISTLASFLKVSSRPSAISSLLNDPLTHGKNEYSVALFTIAKKCKDPKCPTMDTWLNKMWYRHKMEYYYSALKVKEILTHATIWMKTSC